jgi:hypothetical protein
LATTGSKPLGVGLGGGIATSKEPTSADTDAEATGSKPERKTRARRRRLASEDKQWSEGRRNRKINKGNKRKQKENYLPASKWDIVLILLLFKDNEVTICHQKELRSEENLEKEQIKIKKARRFAHLQECYLLLGPQTNEAS